MSAKKGTFQDIQTPSFFDVIAATSGWFQRFKKRNNLRNVKMTGEAASAANEEAAKFVAEFRVRMEDAGYNLAQIFNADETGLYWKKLPDRTYVTKQQNTVPGRKMMKDRVTVLLCGNAAGDCKIKPMVVHKSETPVAFRKKWGNPKTWKKSEKLPVYWRWNTKAWATRVVFKEWLNEVFAPEVKAYLEEKNFDLRAVLLLDNCPAHPDDSVLADENKWIKVSLNFFYCD